MRAMMLHRFGSPLEAVDVPRPVPGEGEVLVRMGACGVCATDLKLAAGRLSYLRVPHIPGHEVAGEVVEVGPGVVHRGVGDRVTVYIYVTCGFCRMCRSGRENICLNLRGRIGMDRPGGFAEYVVVPAANCIRVSDRLSWAEAAVLPDAVVTMYNALVTRARLGLGDWVVIAGAGGLGAYGIQLAKRSGAHVIVLDVQEAKLDWALKLGADAAFDARAADRRQRILGLTGGHGADVVANLVGTPESLSESLGWLRHGGKLLVVGYSPEHPFPADSFAMHLGELEIIGVRSATRQDLHAVVRLVEGGELQSAVTQELPLASANEALAAVKAGSVLGRLVLIP
ncbi:MAG TPA: alcohol dehydrogenase catalytic domain-containing protein [Candidatus Methylomirabilis sp.]